MHAIRPGLVLLASLVLAACATDRKVETAKTNDAEYEYVSSLDSKIPTKVKKGERGPTTSPTGAVSQGEAENLIREAGGQMRAGGQP